MLSCNTVTKHGKYGVVKDSTLSGVRRHRRVDSHQKSANVDSTVSLDLVPLKEAVLQMKTKLQEANDDISNQFERYKTEVNLTIQLAVKSKVTALEKELEACRKELGDAKAKNQYFERLDSHEQRFLDGRYLEYPEEDISFYKDANSDNSTEVSLTRVWKFPIKEYRYEGVLKQEADNAAVGYMRLFGQAYLARSGQNQDKQGFINRNHWATEALSLAELVGTSFPADKHYEKHVEPQLIAFYVTRMLEASGHNLARFGDPNTYQGQQRSANLVPVIIHVSENYICPSCENFIEKVNVIMEKYGFYFEAVPESE